MEFEDRIPKLITGYLRGDLTASQQRELLDWVNEADANRLYFIQATDEKRMTEKFRHFNREDITPRLDKTLESIDHGSKSTGKAIMRKMKKYTIAASFVLIAGTVTYYATRVIDKKDIAKTPTTIKNNTNDVQPGTEKAVLTLADGATIILDDSEKGIINEQNGITVTNQGSQLKYDASRSKVLNQPLSYYTLNTPRGGQYQLLLADGSKVFLNAASSIRFPTAFTGNERKVEITGEAYFEVAKDAKKPFKVYVNGMQIEVLGTHFNVNAYSDESSITTTLLEGLVKITKGGTNSVIKPGQQANLNASGEIKIVNDVNLGKVTAWNDQTFYFAGDDLKTVMRQLSRWYDVDVAYGGSISNPKLSGMISRNRNLSEVLKALELNDIHFRIDGRKITVTQ
jgi:ferric-dicitrate binding protein FerR (iron transport regulator)